MTYKRICSWCGKEIAGPVPVGLTGDTHGLHPDCKEKQLKELEVFLEEQQNESNNCSKKS